MEIKLYKCSASNEPNMRSAMVEAGAVFPDIYFNSEKLTEILKLVSKDKFVVLPLCNTLSAEALGANLNFGDNTIDPFIEDYKYDNITDFLSNSTEFTHFTKFSYDDYDGNPDCNDKENMILDCETAVNRAASIDIGINELRREYLISSERIEVIMKSIKNLSSSGYTVSFNLDGPITILASLIDSMKLFKSFRKEPEELKKAIKYLTEIIIDLGYRALDNGASIISYSDSSGTVDLIGPKYYKEFCVEPNIEILSSLTEYIELKNYGAILHLCGKTTSGLYQSGALDIIPHEANEPNYMESIKRILKANGADNINYKTNIDDNTSKSNNKDDNNKDYANHMKIIGNSCLNRLNSPCFNNKVYEIKIK